MNVQCKHRPPCPGCPGLGEGVAGLPIVAALRELSDRWGASFELAAPRDPLGYRHRARLAIRGHAEAPHIGIFERGSHRVVNIPECLVQHPRINGVAGLLADAIREADLPPYQDGAHRGLLRYLQVALDTTGERVQLTLVSKGTTPEPVAALWPRLQASLGERLQGLFWNGQPERSNSILGPHWQLIAGERALDDHIAGAQVFFPPDAFAQNNPGVYTDVIERVRSWVAPDRGLVEFYAGVGTIGLSLLPDARSVAFNELGVGSLTGLDMGLAALPPVLRERTRVLRGRAGEHAAQVAGAEVVIVDPPRKGLDPELLEALCDPQAGPAQLLYVSCGPEAFMREAERIHTVMPLRELVVFDLFPWTGHVETLARFER